MGDTTDDEGEVAEILHGLLDLGASHAAILDAHPIAGAPHELGGDRWLDVDVPHPMDPAASAHLAAATAEAVIRLRALARALGEALPPCALEATPERADAIERARNRVYGLVSGVSASCGASSAALVRHDALIAEVGSLGSAHRSDVVDAVGLVATDAHARSGTSHGEHATDVRYARSIGLDATIVLFFDAPWSPDFVRHRVALIARELGAVLPFLDPDPTTTAPSVRSR